MFGVYSIRNKINGKVYIGSTTQSFERRWNKHLSSLKLNKHQNRYLQRAYNKCGEDVFEFRVVESLNEDDDVLAAEQFYIDVFWGDSCYNLNPIAGSCKGVKRSKTFCERLSAIHKGKKLSKEQKENLSRIHKERCKSGGKWALEHSARMKGKPQPHKAAIARAMKIKTWRGFISPDGIEYRNIEDLVVFAKEHELNAQGLRRLGRGERSHYKHWRAI